MRRLKFCHSTYLFLAFQLKVGTEIALAGMVVLYAAVVVVVVPEPPAEVVLTVGTAGTGQVVVSGTPGVDIV